MRVVGLDLGSRRIGVAVSDDNARLAVSHSVIDRGADHDTDHSRIAEIVSEVSAEKIIVGLPLSLDGSRGAAAENIAAEVEEIQARIPVPVEVFDERFTTVSAERGLIAARVKGSSRRSVIDQAAAAVILQSWLDARNYE